MPSDIKDVLVQDALDVLEKAKFGIDGDDHVFVRTTARGTFTPSGLTIGGRVTCMQVSTSVIPLPTSPLANRNAISITNLDDTKTLYVGYHSGITADRAIGTNAGWEVPPNETFNKDITDNIIIYGVVASGTILIKIDENA